MNSSQKLWFEILDKQVKQLRKLSGHENPTDNQKPNHQLPVNIECDLPGFCPPRMPIPLPNPPAKKATLALGLVFDNLVTHLKLGWSIFKDASPPETKSPQPSGDLKAILEAQLEAQQRENADRSARAAQESRRRAEAEMETETLISSRDNDEYRPWWGRKTKFVEFANHACNLIRKAGKERHIRLLAVQPLHDHFKAFLEMTDLKDSKKKRTFVGLNSEESFTRAVAETLGINLTEKEKKDRGGQYFNLSHLLADLEKKIKESE